MRHLHQIGPIASLIACAGMMVPSATCDAETTGQAAPPATLAKMIVSDVMMAAEASMNGRVVNRSGRVVPDAQVSIARGKQIMASTRTDRNGDFSFRGLNGGVYRISVPNGGRVVRLWVPQTAPPSATETVTVVVPEPTVLGQHQPGPLGNLIEKSKYALTNPYVVGGIVLGAIAIPVAIHNRNRGSGS